MGLNSEPLKEYRNDLIKSTLLFTIAIAIEFKKGNLSKKDKETISNEIWATLNFTKNEGEEPFAEPQENESINPNILQKEYYGQYIYKYYETIFDYIIGIDTFIEKKLLQKQNKNMVYHKRKIYQNVTKHSMKLARMLSSKFQMKNTRID